MSRTAPRARRPLADDLALPLVAVLIASVFLLAPRGAPVSTAHLLAGEYVLDDVDWPGWPDQHVDGEGTLRENFGEGIARIRLLADGTYAPQGGMAEWSRLAAWAVSVGAKSDRAQPEEGDLLTMDDVEFVTSSIERPDEAALPAFTWYPKDDGIVVFLGEHPYSELHLLEDGRLWEILGGPAESRLIWRRLE